jgi:hypothetical protein
MASLRSVKELLVPTGYQAGWTPEPVWTIWRSGNSLPYQDWNSDPLANHYTDCVNTAPTINMYQWLLLISVPQNKMQIQIKWIWKCFFSKG